MNAAQLRAARAMLRIGVREVASETGITAGTISRAENGSDPKMSTVNALEDFYQSRGVRFVEDGDFVGAMLGPAPQGNLFEGDQKTG